MLQVEILWVVTLCSVAQISETLVSYIAWYHNPEDLDLNFHILETSNLAYCMLHQVTSFPHQF